MLAFGASAGGAACGCETSTRALAVAVPPGPAAVIVYVVDCDGVTGVEPSGATLPTPGCKSRSVAFVEDHESVADAPEAIGLEGALRVTVGLVGVGAGAGAG